MFAYSKSSATKQNKFNGRRSRTMSGISGLAASHSFPKARSTPCAYTSGACLGRLGSGQWWTGIGTKWSCGDPSCSKLGLHKSLAVSSPGPKQRRYLCCLSGAFCSLTAKVFVNSLPACKIEVQTIFWSTRRFTINTSFNDLTMSIHQHSFSFPSS